MKQRKYHPGNLIPMFRLAAKLCKRMRKGGFTDNGGAIHSAERVLNILGQCLVYPELSHINNLRKSDKAEFSVAARAAFARGDKVLIEHVSPVRDLTRRAIDKIDELDDDGFAKYVKKHFRLVLLTPEETARLNRQNRSKISSKRLAGIKMAKRPKKPRRERLRPRNRSGETADRGLDGVKVRAARLRNWVCRTDRPCEMRTAVPVRQTTEPELLLPL
jgi:hypothetical protein